MSTIRKQSIISSVVVYVGLALGALINYIGARELDPDQYGLISGMFVAVGTILYSMAGLGMQGYVGKFYPYYKDNLRPEENDQLTWALLISLAGFVVTVVLGILFKDQVVRFYQQRSPEMLHYYYWIFPFALGMTLFAVLEAYGWQVRQAVLTSYLREVQIRLTTLVLIVLYLTGVLGSFGMLVKLYAFNYLLISLIMLVYLFRTGRMHFVFSVSRVTRKFYAKARAVSLLAWSGNLLFNIAFYFAQVVIAGVVAGGLTAVGIFTLAQFVGSLIQAPQRGLIAATMGPLAQAWKDKDYERIRRIYHRSSITQLIFSVGMFLLIWMNYRDGIETFHLKAAFLAGQYAFLFIGLARVVDLGTGVNSQIIITSVHWRFELFSGMILVTLTIPLNYWLAKTMGLVGPAVADLITFFIYNGIRWLFLYRKYGLQPFDRKSAYAILLGAAAYAICYLLFGHRSGLIWMIVRSAAFLLLYVSGVFALHLSHDVMQVWQTMQKRLLRMTGRSDQL